MQTKMKQKKEQDHQDKTLEVYYKINESRNSLLHLLDLISNNGIAYQAALSVENLEIIDTYIKECFDKISKKIVENELQNKIDIGKPIKKREHTVKKMEDDDNQIIKKKNSSNLKSMFNSAKQQTESQQLQKLQYRENFETILSRGLPIYKCKICSDKFFQNYCACHNHWKVAHCEDKYFCKCGACFQTIEDFFVHYYVLHSEEYKDKSEYFQCELCLKTFERKKLFMQHLNKLHIFELQEKLEEFKKDQFKKWLQQDL